eukprot:s1528_g4.t1
MPRDTGKGFGKKRAMTQTQSVKKRRVGTDKVEITSQEFQMAEAEVVETNTWFDEFREIHKKVEDNKEDGAFHQIIKDLTLDDATRLSDTYYNSKSSQIDRFVPELSLALLPWLKEAKKAHDDYLTVKFAVDKMLETAYRETYSMGTNVSNKTFERELELSIHSLEKEQAKIDGITEGMGTLNIKGKDQ